MSKVYRRDVLASLFSFIEDAGALPSGLEVIHPFVRPPTRDLVAFARMSVELRREPTPRDAIALARGVARFDVMVDLVDRDDVDSRDSALLTACSDDLVAVLEQENVLVFGVRSWLAAGGASGTLSAGITAGEDSLVVVDGAAFQEDTQELTVGVERIGWTTKTPSGADATFSGLTRGLGHTSAAAHAAGVSVADNLGAAIARAEHGEAENSHLGWDVASQRLRGLLRVPFRLDYASS